MGLTEVVTKNQRGNISNELCLSDSVISFTGLLTFLINF